VAAALEPTGDAGTAPEPPVDAAPPPPARPPTPQPFAAPEPTPAPAPAPVAPPAAPPASPVSATFGSGSSVQLGALRETPSDDLIDDLTTTLRNYPEVEWAAFCMASRGPAPAQPTIGLRIDVSYRERINDIIGDIRKAGEPHGASLDVLLLDDPVLMRTARKEALAFYPWRRR
jgi:hypothetical protein